MNAHQQHHSVLMGSACPEKAEVTKRHLPTLEPEPFVMPVRTYSIAGDEQASIAGNFGAAMAGTNGRATAGEIGFALAGDYGTATAADFGTAIAGDRGTAIVGAGGIASAGEWGHAIAGNSGIAEAGELGQVQAGEGGQLRIHYCKRGDPRRRVAVGYIGEAGLLPDTPYHLDANHQFVPVIARQGEPS